MTARTRLDEATLDWNAVEVGAIVTPMIIDVTATVVVAGAIATRDFMPVHHDRDYAASQGSPNIFLNILTSNGFCGRFLTDWAGPEAAVRKLSIRMGLPAYAGARLEFTGTVTGKSRAGDEGVVEVALRATTGEGEHLSGTAVVGLPLRGAAS